jgi:hypothetical protein
MSTLTHTPKSHVAQTPQWLLDADCEGRVTIRRDGRVTWRLGIWRGGTWEGGTWRGGLWCDGTWQGGAWNKGVWRDGTWQGGTWRDGTWLSGTWLDGMWIDGMWGDGTWWGGTWHGGTWIGGLWNDPSILAAVVAGLPELLTAGGHTLDEVCAAWGERSWGSSPMSVAFDVDDPSGIPKQWRLRAAQFRCVYGRALLKNPLVLPDATC